MAWVLNFDPFRPDLADWFHDPLLTVTAVVKEGKSPTALGRLFGTNATKKKLRCVFQQLKEVSLEIGPKMPFSKVIYFTVTLTRLVPLFNTSRPNEHAPVMVLLLTELRESIREHLDALFDELETDMSATMATIQHIESNASAPPTMSPSTTSPTSSSATASFITQFSEAMAHNFSNFHKLSFTKPMARVVHAVKILSMVCEFPKLRVLRGSQVSSARVVLGLTENVKNKLLDYVILGREQLTACQDACELHGSHKLRSFHKRALQVYDFHQLYDEKLKAVFPQAVMDAMAGEPNSASSPESLNRLKEGMKTAGLSLPLECPHLIDLKDTSIPVTLLEEYEYLQSLYQALVGNTKKIQEDFPAQFPQVLPNFCTPSFTPFLSVENFSEYRQLMTLYAKYMDKLVFVTDSWSMAIRKLFPLLETLEIFRAQNIQRFLTNFVTPFSESEVKLAAPSPRSDNETSELTPEGETGDEGDTHSPRVSSVQEARSVSPAASPAISTSTSNASSTVTDTTPDAPTPTTTATSSSTASQTLSARPPRPSTNLELGSLSSPSSPSPLSPLALLSQRADESHSNKFATQEISTAVKSKSHMSLRESNPRKLKRAPSPVSLVPHSAHSHGVRKSSIRLIPGIYHRETDEKDVLEPPPSSASLFPRNLQRRSHKRLLSLESDQKRGLPSSRGSHLSESDWSSDGDDWSSDSESGEELDEVESELEQLMCLVRKTEKRTSNPSSSSQLPRPPPPLQNSKEEVSDKSPSLALKKKSRPKKNWRRSNRVRTFDIVNNSGTLDSLMDSLSPSSGIDESVGDEIDSIMRELGMGEPM